MTRTPSPRRTADLPCDRLYIRQRAGFPWRASVWRVLLCCALLLFAASSPLTSATVLVTNMNDSGAGSLYQAIQDANTALCQSPCAIGFAIPGPLPGSGEFVIQPTTNFPLVVTASNVTIDATTEATFLGGPPVAGLVAIDGGGGAWDGITVIPAGADIAAVTIRGLSIRNFGNGVGINVHSVDGYVIYGARIAGNFIGMARNGTPMPNKIGIVFGPNAHFGLIGVDPQSPVSIDRNVISGNTDAAIVVSALRSNIIGNFIGTDPSGGTPAPNGAGILFESGSYEVGVIPLAGFPNVIAFNHGDAVRVADGATAIHITGNSIHDNGFGINLYPSTGADGPTPNDPGDADTGGNEVQNFPVLTSKTFDGTNTVLGGTLSTTPGGGYRWRIDFYANTLPNPTGYGEGETWIGQTEVAPDVEGNAIFSVPIPGDYTSKYISATAAMSGAPPGISGWTSKTSEFSRLIEADLSVSMTGTPGPVSCGATISYDVTVANAGPAADDGTHVTITFDPSLSQETVVAPAGWMCLGSPIQFPPPDVKPPMYYDCYPSGGFAAGANALFQASAVAPVLPTTVTASATVTTQGADPNAANNGPVSVATAVGGPADLAISVVDAPDPVLAGGTISYAITVTNSGPDPAESVSVSFSFDPTGASVTPPAGWQCVVAIPDPPPGYQGVWAPGALFGCYPLSPLLPGTYVFQAQATPFATSGTYVMTASVSSSTFDPDESNNGPLNVVTAIGLNADLDLSLSGGSTPVAGSIFSYTLLVTNSGPSSVSGLRLLDTLNFGAPGKKSAELRRRFRPVIPALAGETWSCTATSGSACGTASGTGDVDVLLDIAAGGTVAIDVSAPIPSTATGTLTHRTSLILPPGVTDPTPAGNMSLVTLPLTLSADLSVSISRAPVTPQAGGIVTYDILIWNSGPSAVVGARLSDVLPTGLLDAQWSCTPAVGAVCSAPAGFGDVDVLLDLSVGAQVVIKLDATIAPTLTGSLANTATMTPPAGTADPDSTNNAATDSVAVQGCPAGPEPLSPIGTTIDNPATVTFTWSDAGATSYELFLSINGADFVAVATSSGTSVSIPVSGGTLAWYVASLAGACHTAGPQATFIVRICLEPVTPVPFLVGEVNSDERFTFSWTTPDSDVTFEYRDSPTKEFGDTAWVPTAATEVIFTYTNVNVTPVDYWFQVRAVRDCPLGVLQSTPSPAVHIVIRPAGTGSDSANVENGQGRIVNQLLRICANAQGHIVPCNDPFATAAGVGAFDVPVTITTDRPWMTVTPATTTIPPGGVSLIVTSNPQGLPTGTNTGSVVVAQPGGSTSNVPFSVNVVTPVSPQPKTPPRDALIIPAVAHADGIGSRWQSDIRVTNLALRPVTYELSLTPSGVDGTINGKKTEVTIEPGETKALDDVVKQWYGLGSLGDGTNGVLEIRPAESGKRVGATSVERFSTVASSRTYNSTPDGTYGQWIPAVPFAEFVGRDPGDGSATLSLQHIAHSASYRTNLGVVEGAGAAARVLISVFDASGTKVDEFTRDLKAMEHQQLNSFLGEKGITLENGRIEVKVTEGQGRITAYASVIDSSTNDPLFVPAVNARAREALRYVVPGLADLDTGVNCWRSDILVFNPSPADVDATLVFYAQNDPATTRTARLSLPSRQVLLLDDALDTLFGLTAIGGAVHVVPDASHSLVVTARTYDETDAGTYGQFISAVTADDAVGVDDRALEILQIEQSDRYRTNLGLVEVSGKSATVEVTAVVPLSTVAPTMRVTLPANGFTQLLNVLQQMNLGTVYNVRLSVKVVGGEGRVSAYGSVIDQRTQDPTYVKAQ